ncbi:MAG: OmpH family outer membrane protein, partial [Muribaculaceae bacterium]
MLRKIIYLIAILIAGNMAAQGRFGVVDFDAVLDSLPEYSLVKFQIQETSNRYQEEFKKMSDDIDRKFEDYQTLNSNGVTPESIRQRRIQEIQNLQKRAQQFLET